MTSDSESNIDRGAKKIAYFSTSKIPSREANCVHILKMVSALSAQGAAVILYGMRGEEEFCSASIQKRFSLRSGDFETRLFNFKAFPAWKILHGVAVAVDAKRNGVQQAIGRCAYCCFFASLLGIDVIFEIHSLKRLRTIHGIILRRLLRSSRLVKVISITEALKKEFAQVYQFSEDRIEVLSDCADAIPAGTKPHVLRRNGRTVAMYAGSLYPGKGMEVIEKLAANEPDVDFHVLGGQAKDLERWAKRLEGKENIIFYGHVPPAEVPAYLLGADILLLPNQRVVVAAGGEDIGRWTSPLKLFEYMAAGKPIIASDLSVLREVLTDGYNTLLCSSDDVAEWKAALGRLRGDSQLASVLGLNAKRDFESKYTWSSRARGVLAMLNAKGS